jgi:hypothetical protein
MLLPQIGIVLHLGALALVALVRLINPGLLSDAEPV